MNTAAYNEWRGRTVDPRGSQNLSRRQQDSQLTRPNLQTELHPRNAVCHGAQGFEPAVVITRRDFGMLPNLPL